MIVVTGANGHLGRATVEELLQQDTAEKIAVSVREPEKAAALTPKGIEVRQGDYGDYQSLLGAFKGAHTLLLISGDAPVEVRIQQHHMAVDAAKSAGVKHVVYTSIVNPIKTSPFTFAAIHADTEAYLKNSGLHYTIFRNGLYLDALPMIIGNPVESRKIYFPGGSGKMALVARLDIAEALAKVLIQPTAHQNQTYTIALDTAYSFGDIAITLGELSRTAIEYTAIPLEALEQELRKQQLPDFLVEAMTGMAKAVQDGRFDQPDSTLEKLLGRRPLGLREFLQTTYLDSTVPTA